MKRHLPLLITASLAILMLFIGPDVLSNIGFAVAGIWAWLCARKRHTAGRPGYLLFAAALVMTAAGSAYYHLRPDDARLLWDRIPIALACAGLLATVRGDAGEATAVRRDTSLLAIFAIFSVAWWFKTGDLRPYLFLQALPLLLIPVWQWLHHAPRIERLGFAAAILLYVLAKAAELHDHDVLALSGVVSGHTLKHLLATAAAFSITAALASPRRE